MVYPRCLQDNDIRRGFLGQKNMFLSCLNLHCGPSATHVNNHLCAELDTLLEDVDELYFLLSTPKHVGENESRGAPINQLIILE